MCPLFLLYLKTGVSPSWGKSQGGWWAGALCDAKTPWMKLPWQQLHPITKGDASWLDSPSGGGVSMEASGLQLKAGSLSGWGDLVQRVCVGHTGTPAESQHWGVCHPNINGTSQRFLHLFLPLHPNSGSTTRGKVRQGTKTAQTQVLSPLWASGEASKWESDRKWDDAQKYLGKQRDLPRVPWTWSRETGWAVLLMHNEVTNSGNLEAGFPTRGPQQPGLEWARIITS